MGDNKIAGGIVVALGIAMAVAGIFAYSYEETVLDLYFYEVVSHPYQDIGLALLVLGIIALVVGIIFATVPAKSPLPPIQQAMYTVAPGTCAFCSYCGRQLAPGAAFCPGCGRKPT